MSENISTKIMPVVNGLNEYVRDNKEENPALEGWTFNAIQQRGLYTGVEAMFIAPANMSKEEIKKGRSMPPELAEKVTEAFSKDGLSMMQHFVTRSSAGPDRY